MITVVDASGKDIQEGFYISIEDAKIIYLRPDGCNFDIEVDGHQINTFNFQNAPLYRRATQQELKIRIGWLEGGLERTTIEILETKIVDGDLVTITTLTDIPA